MHDTREAIVHGYRTLKGLPLVARDGRAGQVVDLYFDDHAWAARYLIGHLDGQNRSVLIELEAIGRLSEPSHQVAVGLTRAQLAQAPDAATIRPVSEQAAPTGRRWRSWPPYSTTAALSAPVAAGLQPGAAAAVEGDKRWAPLADEAGAARRDDPHLRSMEEVTGYVCRREDTELGHVEDFLLDERDWSVRAVVIRSPSDPTEREIASNDVRALDCGARTMYLEGRADPTGPPTGRSRTH